MCILSSVVISIRFVLFCLVDVLRHIGDEDGMATLGRIEEFDGSDWQQYVERLEYFFTANGIEDGAKKRAVFLSVVGPATYKTLRNILSPAKPGEKEYSELVEKLSQHYRPAPSEIVERFKFHSRSRKPGESVATFVAELHSLVEFCNFGETLEVMIRDLVCGINDTAIQKRLLAEPTLTYAKALEIAQATETGAQSLRELRSKPEEGRTSPKADIHHTAASSSSSTESPPIVCFRCGRPGHTVAKCRVDKSVVCHNCGKSGHLKRACKGKSKTTKRKYDGWRKPKAVRNVGDSEEEKEEDVDSEELSHLQSRGTSKSPPIMVEIKVDDCTLPMEVDTGASVSLMSYSTFSKLWPGRSLESTSVRLRTYSKEPLSVVGKCKVNVDYNGQMGEFTLLIVEGSGPTLLERDWLSRIRLDWSQINHVHSPSLQSVLDRYPSVFQDGLGTLRGFTAKIYVEATAEPKFHPARSVPYALREMVDKELTRLQEAGTLEPVEISKWAAPIVAVLKRDKKSVRICGDFSVTVNPISKLDRYPIPKIEDLFARLSNGKFYSKIDFSHAYQQLLLDEESKKYVVVNTHRGLFRYTRFPFGISSAPGIFQRVIEGILQGVKGVVVYLDDILISGSSEDQHLVVLDDVLGRLDRAGLRVKRSKCEFLRPSVIYLGHKIDGQGLHPLPERIRAIRDAPAPESVSALKSHLGMLTYYSKFLPNLSTLLHPLYQLLHKGVTWHWGQEQKRAFRKSKELLMSARCLTHFNSTLVLTLACDASAYGLGAVLSHRMGDGTERPIGYASRTLTDAERNYSQLEKEGLALIFGIKRFHDYLFGRSFQLITDHKPLFGLLKENRSVSPQASARIKRWSLFLST